MPGLAGLHVPGDRQGRCAGDAAGELEGLAEVVHRRDVSFGRQAFEHRDRLGVPAAHLEGDPRDLQRRHVTRMQPERGQGRLHRLVVAHGGGGGDGQVEMEGPVVGVPGQKIPVRADAHDAIADGKEGAPEMAPALVVLGILGDRALAGGDVALERHRRAAGGEALLGGCGRRDQEGGQDGMHAHAAEASKSLPADHC